MIRKHSCRANVLKSMAVSLWNQEQKILSRNVLPPAEIVFSSPRSAFHLHSGLVGSACLTRFNLDSVRVERPQERARSGLLGSFLEADSVDLRGSICTGDCTRRIPHWRLLAWSPRSDSLVSVITAVFLSGGAALAHSLCIV